MKYYLKLVTGFRRDQEHTISANEAHKAYYLFDHPDTRSTFSNGLAIRGDQIQEIIPDYQTTMGWNPTHILDSDDHNELNSNGIARKMREIMSVAKEIAKLGDPTDLNTPLSELMKNKYPQLKNNENREHGIKRIGELI